MLNIGFVVPTGKRNYDPFRNHPLVALYLLTIIEQYFNEKVNLSLIDLRGQDKILNHIPKSDVFLYSVATPDFSEISGIVQELRSIYSQAKHIAGGPHINLFPEQSSSVFDTIVLGEAEESIIEVINDILAMNLKPIYKQKNSIDINKYSYPSRKYLLRNAVITYGLLAKKYSALRATSALLTRGCPFNCHFCANKYLTFGPVRFRSPKLITEEIEYLKKEYQIEALAFKDDNIIPVNQRIARPFLEAIGQTGIIWRGQTRANNIHPDMVKLAWESGCREVSMGIESVSPTVLKIVNKNIDLKKAKDYILFLRKTGIFVRVNFILGLPGEPDDVVEQTLKFIDDAGVESVFLTIFTPISGSEMWQHPERFSIKLCKTAKYNAVLVFGRFNAEEIPTALDFTHDEVTPWGKGKTSERIIQDYIKLQSILRERKLNF